MASEELLSPHLSVGEFLATQQRDLVAEQWRLWDGTPALQDAGRHFAKTVFEQVRAAVGTALHVNSGYRCPPLNTLVGGVPTSRHMLALAADVVPVGITLLEAMRRIADATAAGQIPDLDKAIVECGVWIHVQGAPLGQVPRRQCLVTADTVHFQRFA